MQTSSYLFKYLSEIFLWCVSRALVASEVHKQLAGNVLTLTHVVCCEWDKVRKLKTCCSCTAGVMRGEVVLLTTCSTELEGTVHVRHAGKMLSTATKYFNSEAECSTSQMHKGKNFPPPVAHSTQKASASLFIMHCWSSHFMSGKIMAQHFMCKITISNFRN